MDIDSLAACFMGQFVIGSKSGGFMSRKSSADSKSSRRAKRGPQKGSNMVQSSSKDIPIREGFSSEGQQVEVESVPVETPSIPELRPCSDGLVVSGIEIAPTVRFIFHNPRPPVREMTVSERELGWSTLDIRTRNGWSGDGAKPFDKLKVFRIPANVAYYYSMEMSSFTGHSWLVTERYDLSTFSILVGLLGCKDYPSIAQRHI